jgi:RND family efflux transporter MFP subunit
MKTSSAAFLLAGALATGPLPAQTVPVPTVVVGTASAARVAEFDATLQAVQQSTVAAQVPGNVLALLVKAGDRVRAGQPIARIDERDVQAALARGDAGVAQAEAELRNARMAAERTRELRTQGFVSQAALDTAETQLKAAQAGAAQAQAARSQAALARSFAGVTAPFDAIVLATHLEPGDLAAPGRPIATLYAPGRLRASVQVPASLSALARQAAKVEVQLPSSAGAAAASEGRWIEPAGRTELPGADAVAQTVEWRLELPAAASTGLAPGMAVRVRFTAAPTASVAGPGAADAPRLVIPAAAVLRRGELTAVYAVQGSQFVLKPVRLGARQGTQVEVVAGLKAGERIALDPVRAGLGGAAAQ